MKLAETPEEQRRWMEQWREAAVMLEEVRRHDLALLDEAEAWRQIEAVQTGMGDAWRNPGEPCGLIEQQAQFRKLAR